MPEFEPPVLETAGDDPRSVDPAGRFTARRRAARLALRRLPRPLRTGLTIGAATLLVIGGVFASGYATEQLTAGPRDPANITRFDLSAPRARILELPGKVVSVDFTADGFGVALAQQCADDACNRSLAITTDGRRWLTRPLPKPVAHVDTYERTIVNLLPRRRIRISGTTTEPWFSTDGGLTWRPVAASPGAPVTSAKPGRLVLMPPKVSHGCLNGAELGVVSASDGRLSPLRHQPGIEVCWLSPVADPRGWHWAGGVDRATHRPAIATTRDHGKTWQVEKLPASRSAIGAMVTWSDQQRYAVVLAGTYDPYVLLQSIYQGGPRDWERVAKWPAQELVTVRGAMVVQPDGGLLLVSTAGLVVGSADGGKTFAPTGHPLRLGPIRRTERGWLAQLQNDTHDWLHSRDGVTWQRLAVR